jgi:hypothetical protein
MPILYSSIKHPKKFVKVKSTPDINRFYLYFLCHDALRFMCLLIKLYVYEIQVNYRRYAVEEEG